MGPAEGAGRRAAGGSAACRVQTGAPPAAAARAAPFDADQFAQTADDAAAQEEDQKHERQAEHQLPGGAELERGLQEILQEQPHGGAEQRTEQRPDPADRGLDHELA